jgi:hypothetical protein
VLFCYILNRTLTFDWHVVHEGSKNKHHKNTCDIKEWTPTYISSISPRSTMNTIGRSYVFQLRGQQTCTSNNLN